MSLDVDGFGLFSEELRELQEDIETIRKDIPEVLDKATDDAATDLEVRMVKRAPSDSGNLRRSIESEPTATAEANGFARYEVGPTAEYAPYVNFGTNPHYITPKDLTVQEAKRMERETEKKGELTEEVLEADSLKFNGEFRGLIVKHPGTDAQPFFSNAVNKFSEDESFVDHLNRETNRLFAAEMR